jgi:DNA-directed RNA polymerase specialized sigma24 family protein
MKKPDESDTTRGGEEALLRFLGISADELDEKYLEIRRKLVHFFVYRGRSDFEELADRTIFEVVKDCERVVDSYVGEPMLWVYGVARNILRGTSEKPLPPLIMPEPDPAEVKQARDECLHHCLLHTLEDEERALIIQYYEGEKGRKIDNRKRLADLLRTTPNGLRLRVHRIRNVLRECLTRCLTANGFM